MELQTTFYIIGIIYMIINLILITALVIGVFVIRAKINHIHDELVNKLRILSTVAEVSTGFLGKTSSVLLAAKKLLNKKPARHAH